MHSKFPLARFIACSVTIVSALFIGCGSSSHKTPSPSPGPSGPSNPGTSTASFSVTAVAPAAGATQVPLTATVQVTFSSAATASTVSTKTIQVTDPKPVAGTVSYNTSTNSAVFTPSGPLVANSTYTVTVSGVSGTNGASLAKPFTWNFATITMASTPPPPPPPSPSATVQYQSPLISFGGGGSNLDGQVSIDTAGNMNLQLTGAAANSTYSVQFCTAASSVPCKGNPTPMCFSVGNVSTDANGSGSLAEMFPKPGSWAGDFEVKSSSKVYYETYLVPGLNGETFMSTLQPSSTVNGTGLGSTCTAGASTMQVPLTSGTVTYAKGSATYTVTGTLPNKGFTANESESTYVDSSGTYVTDTFTTNASGDATSTSTSFGPGGDLFQVNPSNVSDGVGFIGGFMVPKQP